MCSIYHSYIHFANFVWIFMYASILLKTGREKNKIKTHKHVSKKQLKTQISINENKKT